MTQAGGRHSNPLRYLRSSATVKSPTTDRDPNYRGSHTSNESRGAVANFLELAESIETRLKEEADFGGMWINEDSRLITIASTTRDLRTLVSHAYSKMDVTVETATVSVPLQALLEVRDIIAADIVNQRYPATYVQRVSLDIKRNVVSIIILDAAPSDIEFRIHRTYPSAFVDVTRGLQPPSFGE